MGWPGRVLMATLLAATLVMAAMHPRARAGPLSAGPCFWVHGRLFAANGAPTFRIWPIGTRRLLGVKTGDGADAAIGDLPEPVRAMVSPDAFQVDVEGDYRVCPLATDRSGRMRQIHIDQAVHLVARPTASRGQSNR